VKSYSGSDCRVVVGLPGGKQLSMPSSWENEDLELTSNFDFVLPGKSLCDFMAEIEMRLFTSMNASSILYPQYGCNWHTGLFDDRPKRGGQKVFDW